MNYLTRALEPIVKKQAGKVTLLTGARQVGKSTLLQHLFPAFKYVTLDDVFALQQAEENPADFLESVGLPAIIDEAQRAPSLFRQIKLLCDSTQDKGQLYLSGSQQYQLMKGVTESLAGRIRIFELSGLSYREKTADPFDGCFIPDEHYAKSRAKTACKPQRLWQAIHRGAYPELADQDADWELFYANYLKSYLERDVRDLAAVHNLRTFERFMVAAASRTGEVLNASNIADEIGSDVTTVKRWLSILETSGIVYLLEPYASTALKRAIKTPKLYFRDTGLVCYLTRWLTADTAERGAMSGHIFETYVVSEIIRSFANAGKDYRHFLSYYRGRDRKRVKRDGKEELIEEEIDLIVEANGTLYPVEIKKGSKVTAEMTAAFQVLDKVKQLRRGMGTVVCTCPMSAPLRDNVQTLPVWMI